MNTSRKFAAISAACALTLYLSAFSARVSAPEPKAVLPEWCVGFEDALDHFVSGHIPLAVNNHPYQDYGQNYCTDVDDPRNETNWTAWEQQEDRIHAGDRSSRFEDPYAQRCVDLDAIADDGFGGVRLALSWNQIQPRCPNEHDDGFDYEKIDHYRQLCAQAKARGQKINATLHHFSHPSWFEDVGAFENEENIEYFLNFSVKAYQELHEYVDYWCTFNEPTVVVLMGYVIAYFGESAFPPGKKSLKLAGRVMRNILFAHCAVYDAIKACDSDGTSCVGINHQPMKYVGYHAGSWNLLARMLEGPVCSAFNYIMHDVFMNFFRSDTGEYRFESKLSPLLGLGRVTCFDELGVDPKSKLDFIAFNYYSQVVFGAQMSLKRPLDACCLPGQRMTDMPYPLYAQGLYDAINELRQVFGDDMPLMLTETGAPDKSESGDVRDEWIKTYFVSIFRAIQDGANIRWVSYWSWRDNFEWAEGWDQHFGLYTADTQTEERVNGYYPFVRAPGSQPLFDLVNYINARSVELALA